MPRRPKPFWIKVNYANASGCSLAVEAPLYLKYGTIEDDLMYLFSEEAKRQMKKEEIEIAECLEKWLSDFRQPHAGENPLLRLKNKAGGWVDISDLTKKAMPYAVPTNVNLFSRTAKIDIIEMIFGYAPHSDGESEGGK